MPQLSKERAYPGWGQDGKALHDSVRPEYWCVSLADLRFLRAEIKKAVSDGEIKPVPVDPETLIGDEFDLTDDVIGPNMYTVVKQYLKPLTAEAGGMSWALLRQPKGMVCDIFITHCWAEGAYELIDRVLWHLESKPLTYTLGIWCCILANPQNLDIGKLIKDYPASPFALALKRSTKMLVVSNHACSIYSRIWCVYEAYLAYEFGRPIEVAQKPPPQDAGLGTRFFGVDDAMEAELKTLSQGFTSVEDAIATQQADKDGILKEIKNGSSISKVDEVIKKVLKQGAKVSTPRVLTDIIHRTLGEPGKWYAEQCPPCLICCFPLVPHLFNMWVCMGRPAPGSPEPKFWELRVACCCCSWPCQLAMMLPWLCIDQEQLDASKLAPWPPAAEPESAPQQEQMV